LSLIKGWIDINGSLEAQTERSLLHLAAKTDNLELIAWGLKHGADPNVKDLKGRKPSDLAKSDRVKEMLKHAKPQAPIHSPSLAQATTSVSPGQKEAPFLKGYFDFLILAFYQNGQTTRMAISPDILSWKVVSCHTIKKLRIIPMLVEVRFRLYQPTLSFPTFLTIHLGLISRDRGM
jgi:hypothetical protein